MAEAMYLRDPIWTTKGRCGKIEECIILFSDLRKDDIDTYDSYLKDA